MNSADSGKVTVGDIDAIISGLGEILISKNIEKIVAAFREALKPVLEYMTKIGYLVEEAKDASGDLKPVLERVEKVEDAVVRMGKEVADFKLSMMKEVLMLRDQLRMLNESLISLERRFASLTSAKEGKVEGEGVVGEEWVLEENKDVRVQKKNIGVQEQANVFVSMKDAAVQKNEAVMKEEKTPVSISTNDDVERLKEIARLETRLVKLNGEILSLQSLIETGLGGVKEKEILSLKLREKKEIEERINKLKRKD
ncbi:MAG: hypothetical protein QXZ06_00240 [Candidatus Jordarchaeales archaeon]